MYSLQCSLQGHPFTLSSLTLLPPWIWNLQNPLAIIKYITSPSRPLYCAVGHRLSPDVYRSFGPHSRLSLPIPVSRSPDKPLLLVPVRQAWAKLGMLCSSVDDLWVGSPEAAHQAGFCAKDWRLLEQQKELQTRLAAILPHCIHACFTPVSALPSQGMRDSY